jgi:SAM-dependent methyltransferase
MVTILSNSTNWINEFFINKGELFLRVLNKMWEKADVEALGVKRILESLGLGEDSLILDLGCGNGRMAVNLAKLGYRVVGVDVSPVFIRDAFEKAKMHGVEDKVNFRTGDARRIDEEFNGNVKFDATIMYWTTIIGYYDESVDADILRRIRRVTRDNGYLLILNTVNFDSTILRAGLLGTGISYFNEVDDELICVEKPIFDPLKAVMTNTWTFYRRVGRDLIFIDEMSFKLRVYTLHELVKLAKENGWQFINAYRDTTTLTPYKPLLSSLNVVFKAE